MLEDPIEQEKLERAIAEALASEVGDERLVTDWVLMVAHVGAESQKTGYISITSASPPHALDGLVLTLQDEVTMELNLDDEG